MSKTSEQQTIEISKLPPEVREQVQKLFNLGADANQKSVTIDPAGYTPNKLANSLMSTSRMFSAEAAKYARPQSSYSPFRPTEYHPFKGNLT